MWTYNVVIGIGWLTLQFVNYNYAVSVGDDPLNMWPSKEEHTKFVGESFVVSCESPGKVVQRLMWTGPDDKQITNYRDKKLIVDSRRVHVEDGVTYQNGVDLVFEEMARTDRGTYTCSANVDGNEVSKSFVLDVLKPMSFKGTEKIQYLNEGSDSSIKCNVESDPKPKITWKYNNNFIRLNKKSVKYALSSENPYWIVVKNASISDGGNYTCSALQLTKSISKRKIFYIDVKVRHRPMESESKHDNESFSYVTGVVNLTCEVIAEPIANFTWLKDNQIVQPSETAKIFNEDQRSVLQLKIVNEDMFGDYICEAINRLGTLKRVVSLEKGIKPSVPKTKVTTIKHSEFRLNLSSKGQSNMPITGFKVELKRPGDDWADANATEFRLGEPYVLDGLKDDTLYVMRVTSKNAAGYSDPSKDFLERTSKVMARDFSSGSVPLTNSSFLCILVTAFLSVRISIAS